MQRCSSRGYKRLSYTSIKGKNVFSWPDKKDIVVTLQKDILMENIVQKKLALVFNSLSELDPHKNLCGSKTNVLKVIFSLNSMMHT